MFSVELIQQSHKVETMASELVKECIKLRQMFGDNNVNPITSKKSVNKEYIKQAVIATVNKALYSR